MADYGSGLYGANIYPPPPPLTSGPVSTVVADQLVNVAQLTDVQRALATLTDQPRSTAVLSEKVV